MPSVVVRLAFPLLPLLAICRAVASTPHLPSRLGRITPARQAELQLHGQGVQQTNVTSGASTLSDVGGVPACPLPQGYLSRRHSAVAALQKSRGKAPFTVCAMGDSITDGMQGHNEIYVCRGGFRPALEQKLDLVGVELSGYRSCPCPAFSTAMSWQLHRELKSTSFQCGSNGGLSHPDLALMMIGTNDLYKAQPQPTALQNTRAMLEDLWAVSPKTEVLLASVPVHPGNAAPFDAYNAGIRDLVADLQAKGRKISYVPMAEEAGLCKTGCSHDGIHPDEAGYARMAQVWYKYAEPKLPKAELAKAELSPTPARGGSASTALSSVAAWVLVSLLALNARY